MGEAHLPAQQPEACQTPWFPPSHEASEQTRLAHRIHKVLEDANVKLGTVASDILGKSGRAMLRALIRGEHDPDKLA